MSGGRKEWLVRSVEPSATIAGMLDLRRCGSLNTRVVDRRAFIVSAGFVLLVTPVAAKAQAGKVYRIGLVGLDAAEVPGHMALRKGLRDLGYEEGKNLVIEFRGADGRYERLPSLTAELVGLKVDVLITNGTPGARAAKQAT